MKCAKILDQQTREQGTMRTMVRKRYTAEFKAQAVELVKLGKAVPVVAEELGIGEGNLYRWVGPQGQLEQVGSGGLRAVGEKPAADELLRLRRENAQLKLENDILKKAAVILGTKPQVPHER
ncbi:MAG TPA: transposase [Terrimicrobiaceae bacterium]|nr:transposase [Terrimicrobiaceae bacterium]